MNGYLPINKPKGITSHDAVMKIRRVAGTKKVGHTGTLDPIAEGLMIVCIGKCTKSADYITSSDKAYIAEMKLGLTSDTYDITGNLSYTDGFDNRNIKKEQIESVLLSFTGKSLQLPPMYSAKKVKGKKLYELARDGITIERTPCPIEIFKIDILSVENDTVRFFVHATKGTYIRSLIHDFGQKLGCGAVMTYLKRTITGGFDLNIIKTADLDSLETKEDIEKLLLPADYIFQSYRKIVLSPLSERILKNGVPLNLFRAGIKNIYEDDEFVRIYNENGDFLALGKIYDKDFIKLMVTFFDN